VQQTVLDEFYTTLNPPSLDDEQLLAEIEEFVHWRCADGTEHSVPVGESCQSSISKMSSPAMRRSLPTTTRKPKKGARIWLPSDAMAHRRRLVPETENARTTL
jgi:hypothetical protein